MCWSIDQLVGPFVGCVVSHHCPCPLPNSLILPCIRPCSHPFLLLVLKSRFAISVLCFGDIRQKCLYSTSCLPLSQFCNINRFALEGIGLIVRWDVSSAHRIEPRVCTKMRLYLAVSGTIRVGWLAVTHWCFWLWFAIAAEELGLGAREKKYHLTATLVQNTWSTFRHE